MERSTPSPVAPSPAPEAAITDRLTGTATFTAWDEEPGWGSGAPVPRLATATVAFSFSGDIEATSDCRYILHYTGDHAGASTGIERVEGRVRGEPATVALRSEGSFDPDGVEIRWSVVPGSGTGALAGARGRGGFRAPAGAREWDWWIEREG